MQYCKKKRERRRKKKRREEREQKKKKNDVSNGGWGKRIVHDSLVVGTSPHASRHRLVTVFRVRRSIRIVLSIVFVKRTFFLHFFEPALEEVREVQR